MLVLLDRDWGVKTDPSRQKFSVTSVGVVFNQWGVKPPQPSRQIERWLHHKHTSLTIGHCVLSHLIWSIRTVPETFCFWMYVCVCVRNNIIKVC